MPHLEMLWEKKKVHLIHPKTRPSSKFKSENTIT